MMRLIPSPTPTFARVGRLRFPESGVDVAISEAVDDEVDVGGDVLGDGVTDDGVTDDGVADDGVADDGVVLGKDGVGKLSKA